MPNRRTLPRLRLFAAATALTAATALALGGCDSGGTEDKSAAGKEASVIAPGKPGETAETLTPAEARKAAPDDTPNSADFDYAQMMIQHHEQAVAMTELAPERGKSKQVKALSERIAAAQQPEIDAMQGWLDTHGGAKKGGHAHGPMPGMATEAQLKKLRAADGEAFDQLFLKLMITHHGGAVTMATDVLAEGNNVLIEEMANDVVAQQTVEINRMREMS